MKRLSQADLWIQLLLILALLMPLVVLFLLPGGGIFQSGLGFWLLLLATFGLLWLLLPSGSRRREETIDITPLPEQPPVLPSELTELIEPRSVQQHGGAVLVRGNLRQPAATAYPRLKEILGEQFVPVLHEDAGGGASLLIVPRPVEMAAQRPIRPLVHWGLFALTVATTTWAGAAHQGVNLLANPALFTVGLPYSLGLMTILGIHELGHYFMARRHGIHVTPPYFIPVPFALGTFGAFIQMRSPTETRTSLFDVAVAGPLAGLAVAIPALLIGLGTSTVHGDQVVGGAGLADGFLRGTSADSSILMALLTRIGAPEALQPGRVLELSPLAFAGWLGLLVTALNLLPIGQLDGGHTARAMFGSRVGGWISNGAMALLLLLAFWKWHGLIMWAIIIFFIAGRGVPPLNDVTPISAGRRVIGYLTFLILALILVPWPRTVWPVTGVDCPYL